MSDGQTEGGGGSAATDNSRRAAPRASEGNASGRSMGTGSHGRPRWQGGCGCRLPASVAAPALTLESKRREERAGRCHTFTPNEPTLAKQRTINQKIHVPLTCGPILWKNHMPAILGSLDVGEIRTTIQNITYWTLVSMNSYLYHNIRPPSKIYYMTFISS